MYPGLVYSDCWVAEQRYHELVAAGLRRQTFAGPSAAQRGAWPAFASLRQDIASLLVRAGKRLLDAQSVSDNRFGTPLSPPRRVVAA